MIKLMIKENAITDLRRIINDLDLSELEDKYSGRYNRSYYYGSNRSYRGNFVPSEKTIKSGLIKWLEDTLKNSYDYDFNTEQLELVATNPPKGPTLAKKSPTLLIGISSTTGDAVLVGEGQFYEYYSGKMDRSRDNRYEPSGVPKNPEPDYDYKEKRASFQDILRTLDLWFEIVKPEGYQSRSDIRKTRNAGITKYTSQDKKYIDKEIYAIEYSLYNPDEARRVYARRIKDLKKRREYEDELNKVESLNDRIRSIDFGHPILGGGAELDKRDVQELKNTYDKLVYNIDDWNNDIEKGYSSTYSEKYAKEYISKLDTLLQDKFNV